MNSPETDYRPGICNIGIPEIRVRKIFLNVFLVVSTLLTLTAVYWCNSVLLWFMLLFSSFSTIVLALEIHYRFCIIFGFFNLHNFKQLGHLQEVDRPEHAKADRQKVKRIMIQALALALFYSSSVHFVSNWVVKH